jgi:hypothetical protein
MILSPHFLASAALAAHIKRPILIVIFALILHFFIDRVPHWDYKVSGTSKLRAGLLVAADLFFGAIVVAVIALAKNWTFHYYFLVNLGVFFGLLPDGLIVLWKMYPQNRYLSTYHYFKKKFHVRARPNFKNGFPQELAVIILAILILTLI